jgi:hypothetical protein
LLRRRRRLHELRERITGRGHRGLLPLAVLLLLLELHKLHLLLLLRLFLSLQLPLVLDEVGKSPESGHDQYPMVKP